jgi:hypothetical protein
MLSRIRHGSSNVNPSTYLLEHSMNLTFSTIALQSIAAAALIAAAPFAAAAAPSHNSETGFDANVAAKAVSSVSRDDVRQGAQIAARQHLNSETGSVQGERQPLASTVSRAEVRAAAIEAVRAGRVGGYSEQNLTPVTM